MKKLLSVIAVALVLTISASAIVPMYIDKSDVMYDGTAAGQSEAFEKITDEVMARAVEASRRVLPDTSVYDEFGYDSFSRTGEYGNEITLNLYWTDTKSGDSANVSVNTDGYISNYSKSYERISDRPVPEISQSEALAAAYEFVCAANPESAKYFDTAHASVNYRKYNSTYSIGFTANENGVVITGAAAQVIISYLTGEIYSFSSTLPSPLDSADETLLSDEDVREAFLEKYPMQLKYVVKYDRETKKSYVDLVYTPSGTDKRINADGELLERINVKGGYKFAVNSSEPMDDMVETESAVEGAFGLTGAESAGIEYQSGFYKPEDVSGLIKAHPELVFDDESKIKDANLYKKTSAYTDVVSYVLAVNYDCENHITYVEINAETGEILSYSDYDKNHETKPLEIDDKEALINEYKAIADVLVKKLYPDTYGEYVLESDGIYLPDEINTWNAAAFVYVRQNQGLDFERDSIGIKVRLGDKKVTSVSYSYSDCEFPSTDGIISAENALDIYIEKVGLTPMLYPAVKLEDGKIYVASGDTTTAKKRLFVGYGYTSAYYQIDAHTGECNDVVTNVRYFKDIAFTDVEDEKLLEKINTLADMNIIERTDKFEPGHTITQGEYAEMMQTVLPIPEVYASSGEDTEVFGEDYDPDKPLTRANAVKAIVYAKGYSEIAELAGIYITRFADNEQISDDVKGYIAIAQGLDLLDDFGDSFMPDREVTRADAVSLIYAEVCR